MIQCQSAEQAKDYHKDELSQSDYYTSDQELRGSFHGKIAMRLGVSGNATKEAFNSLSDNLHPLTGSPLTPRNVGNRIVGYDINFHCPKSVSVLHVLSKDDHILQAFQQSVHDTMLDIEADGKTRVRKNGKDENRQTRELIWAEFIHQTARPTRDAQPDPHLHCHCFTFNVTWDKLEKQYKAGQFRDIKRDMPYYQARFHKRLADNLIAWGYRIRRTKTSFEIVGVPDAVITLLSKRTNEIGQIAKEKGITNAKALDQLGVKTRVKKKKGLKMADLKKDWRRQILALGMSDGKQGGGNPIRYAPDTPPTIVPSECVDHALKHRFERASVIHDRRILETAYRHALGYSGATVGQITNAFRNNKELISVKEGCRLLCTTKEILAQEQRMVGLARTGKGRFTPLYNSSPALTLQGEQADAVIHVLTTSDQISIIRGRAGTGKTMLMKEAVAKIEAAGKKVFVVAPTAQASRSVLKDEGFADAETVAKLLCDPTLQQRLSGQVLWVDEAGLLGTKDMTALLELVSKHKARLILSGDTRQHASVVRGDALRILNKVAGIIPAEVNKIYRQRDTNYRQSVDDLSQGNIKTAFAGFDRMGAIKTTNPGYIGLVSDYMAALNKGKTVLAISPTHAQGEAVTSAIRSALRKAGKLDKKEITLSRLVSLNLTDAEKADCRSYQQGQVVRFNQNRPGIVRGSAWLVSEVSFQGVHIKNVNKETLFLPMDKTQDFDVYHKADINLSKGDAITITRNGFDEKNNRLNNGQILEVVGFAKGRILARNPISKTKYVLQDDFGHLAHAYCVTSHASQGKTVDEVFIAQPAATFLATDMKQFYVSVSRARDQVHIYTDDKEALLDHVSSSGDRQSATELVSPIQSIARKRRNQSVIIKPIVTSVPQQFVRLHAPKLSIQ
ncbi:MobF family relaxase [Niastella koreensis]|nr:MobF family relaxase [Niastella koreensis]